MWRLTILGAGESGYGTAVLAKKQGWEVFVSDNGEIAEGYAQKLRELGVEFEQGGHTAGRILSADEVVKSPGIPDTAPLVVKLRDAEVPIISEIEFAGRYTHAKTICITGSNGKTTVTTLIYQMLRDAGFNVGLGGNIGDSFAYQVATHDFDWYVLELSSFQLDGMTSFKPHIGVLMNITPDHLDRYDNKMELYAQSKMQIVRNMGAGDYFIYCADDPQTIRQMEGREFPMRTLSFSLKKNSVGENICIELEREKLVFSIEKLRIKGQHNRYNAMAAAMAAMAAGVAVESIARTLEEFAGVEHRMESVGVVDGVRYINDSKATNVDAVWYALEGVSAPIVWIAGGTDKGNDYAPLKKLAAEKVKALVCMGVDNTKLKEAFEGVVPVVYDTHSLEEAMERAVECAQSGDTVLLSPACASFDLFKNYEDRGTQYKEYIGKHIVTDKK